MISQFTDFVTRFQKSSSIRGLQIADWGGIKTSPYNDLPQVKTADAMGTIAREIEAQFVLALGDNFYNSGIITNAFDLRFYQTWESVYTAKSIKTIPWYVIAGNHDHRGNVSAQIAFSNLSPIWKFPSLYHSHTIYSDDESISIDLILIDTSTYTGVNSGSKFLDTVHDFSQHEWINKTLADSRANYILVGGHYPVYSIGEHGDTNTLVKNLVPLLKQYNAHYISGHDHVLSHFTGDPNTNYGSSVHGNVNYWVNGLGVECCYPLHNSISYSTLPNNLRYGLYGVDNTTTQVNDTISGFTSIVADRDQLIVTFYNQEGNLLYTSPPVSPRFKESFATQFTRQLFKYSYVVVILLILIVALLTFVCSVFVYHSRVRKIKGRNENSNDDNASLVLDTDSSHGNREIELTRGR